MAPPSPGAPARDRGAALRRTAAATLGLLGAQNLVGTYVNLYVVLPIPGGYGGVLPEILGSAPTAFHALLALFLLLATALGLAVAWATRDAILRLLGATALLGVVVAGYSGYRFVLSGEAVDSLAMEAAFVASVLAEAGLLVRLAGRSPTTSPERSAA